MSRTLDSGAATIVGCDMDGSARAGGVVEQDVVRPNGTTGGLALAVLSDRPAAVVEEYAATRTGSLHQKKRQRLVQRAATRSSEDVMAQAPAGEVGAGKAQSKHISPPRERRTGTCLPTSALPRPKPT